MKASDPRVDAEGILFSVTPVQRFPASTPTRTRQCLISNDALALLAERRHSTEDRMETFMGMHSLIEGVARRMAQAGVRGDPIRLERTSFR